MRVTFDSKGGGPATRVSGALGRILRIAAMGTGALLLAGCATGYALVQPDVAGGGSYYTGNGPYAGQYYGGYYGAGLYSDPFGWYGPYYGSSLSFSIGFGNAWGWPYYSGFYGGAYGGWPWSSGFGYPIYGYGGHGWHRYHHRYTRGGGHHPGWRDPGVGDTPHPHAWLDADNQRVPPRGTRGPTAPDAAPALPIADSARYGRLPSANFAPRGSARMQVPRLANERFSETPVRPAYTAPMPREPAFAPRSIGSMRDMPSMPRDMGAMAQPAFRAAPMRFSAPVAAPAAAARSGSAPATRIR